MKRTLAALLCVSALLSPAALAADSPQVEAAAAVLMEK